jgi:glycosyltransferase involved in cell wall biosynthesis
VALTTAGRPLVSIVIPAYNHALYLAEAIDSVLGQGYPDVELLVLDDGSDDATVDVLERYTGRCFWDTHPNMGQAATLNKGWAKARGPLLGYLSADDALLPGAVGTLVARLAADPGAVLAYPDYELIDRRSRPLRRVRAPDFDYREMVVRFACPPGPGALFRRSALEAAGPWDPRLRMAPDYDFWLRLGLHGHFARVPEVLARLRVHDGSLSFAADSEPASEEYVAITTAYYRSEAVPAALRPARRQALSNAYLVAARSHLKSDRYARGLACAWRALALHPGNLTPRTFKLLATGLSHQLRFGGPARDRGHR